MTEVVPKTFNFGINNFGDPATTCQPSPITEYELTRKDDNGCRKVTYRASKSGFAKSQIYAAVTTFTSEDDVTVKVVVRNREALAKKNWVVRICQKAGVALENIDLWLRCKANRFTEGDMKNLETLRKGLINETKIEHERVQTSKKSVAQTVFDSKYSNLPEETQAELRNSTTTNRHWWQHSFRNQVNSEHYRRDLEKINQHPQMIEKFKYLNQYLKNKPDFSPENFKCDICKTKLSKGDAVIVSYTDPTDNKTKRTLVSKTGAVRLISGNAKVKLKLKSDPDVKFSDSHVEISNKSKSGARSVDPATVKLINFPRNESHLRDMLNEEGEPEELMKSSGAAPENIDISEN